ncbi:Ca2+-binding RTX toxin-like protein [Microvirga flocculans]|uniref:Ca2+-binding RTX toxin-like protein n=1 Tax=Microvirga flocculans TaxID=217168 RepID=A0A7W6ICZ6_9HYPH|nr:calcium-binding protein [Microvirga flocculans]MBB4039187.1 Ca2+-binding RTX toxin-like protein [Microvirga flocculans]
MAQPTASGNEIKIAGNPQLYFREENGKIAALQNGGFIAVWQRYGTEGQTIQAQIYDAAGKKLGTEITLSGPNEQLARNPDVTVLTDGRILVAWDSSNIPTNEFDPLNRDIVAQLLTSDGSKLGATISPSGIFSVDTDMVPKVAALADGGYMIGWNDNAPDYGGSRFMAYTFTATGTREYLAVTGLDYHSPQGDITGLKYGGYAHVATVTQLSETGTDGNGDGIYMELYRGGDPKDYITARVRVNTATVADQGQASITTLSNGDLVVVWTDYNPQEDGSDSCVKARIFTGTGTPRTGEIIVNTTTAGAQYAPVVSALSNGGFVVAFESRVITGPAKFDIDVRAVAFDANGQRTSDDFVVSTQTAGNQMSSSITALANGRFMVSWTDYDLSIRARVFDTGIPGSGDPDPDPDPVPNVMMGDDGDNLLDATKVKGLIDGLGGRDTATYQNAEGGVVVFLSHPEFNTGQAAGDTFKNVEVIVGSTHDDQLIGDAQANEFQGGDGNDLLLGLGGNDILQGGNGDDILRGGEGADQLNGGAGLNVASYEEATGRVVANLQNRSANAGEATGDTYTLIQSLIGSDFNDTLVGDGGANTLTGGNGNDSLVGGDGNDTLVGGAGDDTLVGGNGFDVLDGGAGVNVYADATEGEIVDRPGIAIDVIQTKRSYTLAASSKMEALKADPNAGAISLTGNNSANLLVGNKATNTLKGRGGNDEISGSGGSDKISGETGNDRLIGGSGTDTLTGGSGRDAFVFDDRETSSSKSKADTIADFSGKGGDRIDLRAIDANTKKFGDQNFAFIGTKDFSKAGEVRYEKTKGYTYVYLNTDSDKAAEAVIKLKGSLDLSKGWFVL